MRGDETAPWDPGRSRRELPAAGAEMKRHAHMDRNPHRGLKSRIIDALRTFISADPRGGSKLQSSKR